MKNIFEVFRVDPGENSKDRCLGYNYKSASNAAYYA